MKKFLFALLVMMLLAAVAHASVRIALLPILFQSTIPDVDTRAELEIKIERAIHIPLNATLQLAEYLSPKDSAHLFNDLWQEIYLQDKKADLQDAMRPLAQKLDADIIVCPILKQYSQHVAISYGWNNEDYMISHVRAELIVYDRRTDVLVDKKNSQIYQDTYSLRGTASFLSKICFDKVIEASKLRQLISDLNLPLVEAEDS